MRLCCDLRPVIAAVVAVEIVFVLFTIFISVGIRRVSNVLPTTPSPSDVSTVDYDNDTADGFLANYSIYCEKFLIPQAINIQHSRPTRLCPCVPNDLGWFLCVLFNI